MIRSPNLSEVTISSGDHEKISQIYSDSPIQKFEGRGDLIIGKAVEGEVRVLENGCGMVHAEDPLRHEEGLLLVRHGIPVLAHDVVETGEGAQTERDVGVHRAINVVQQIE